MKPILFNTEMVQAIQVKRKKVTRRLGNRYKIKDFAITEDGCCMATLLDRKGNSVYFGGSYKLFLDYADYKAGDILYVRETWGEKQNDYCYANEENHICPHKHGCCTNELPDGPCFGKHYIYKADGEKPDLKWHPSLHMPKEVARILLRVKEIRVEQLQDISVEQAVKEGIDIGTVDTERYANNKAYALLADNLPIVRFADLWNSTLKKYEVCRLGWKANPWVWVIEFEQIGKEEVEGR